MADTINVPVKRYQELLKIEKDYTEMTNSLNRILKLSENVRLIKSRAKTITEMREDLQT
jgi:hypothetical protein